VTDEADESGFWNDTAWHQRALIVDGYFSDKVNLLADIVRDGMEKQAAVGITAFSSHIMGTKYIDAIMKLNREGRMPIRFGYTHYDGFQANPDPASFYRRMGDLAGLGNDYFWHAAVGLGSVDSGPPRICTTMEAPAEVKKNEYCLNAPGSSTSEAIYTAITSGQRVALGHSYGDKSVDYFMDDIERAMKDKKDITLEYVRSRRFTSDHCGFYPRQDQIPRMAKLGMIISCQANYINRSYPWLEIYGMQYATRVAPVKSLLEGGVRTVMEAEVRVESGTGPSYFVYYLPYLTRTTRAGQKVAPEQAIDRVQVLKMSTSWASEYLMKEDRLGTLEKGKLADFLVLNKDFFTVPQDQIPTVFPMMTVVGGKTVVLREELAKELATKPIGPQIKFTDRPLPDSGGERDEGE
jgi:predicted amidohydrolase YtcJ